MLSKKFGQTAEIGEREGLPAISSGASGRTRNRPAETQQIKVLGGDVNERLKTFLNNHTSSGMRDHQTTRVTSTMDDVNKSIDTIVKSQLTEMHQKEQVNDSLYKNSLAKQYRKNERHFASQEKVAIDHDDITYLEAITSEPNIKVTQSGESLNLETNRTY